MTASTIESEPGSGTPLCAVDVLNTNLGPTQPGTTGAGDPAEIRLMWLTTSAFDADANGAGAVAVPGVGDRAFFVGTAPYFTKHHAAFRLGVHGEPDPAWLRRDEVALAMRIVARL
jgi:hypothetical protein